MLSNTVEVENQPVNFPNFSVENKRCESDPFTIKGGRYIGSDGFVVPRNFGEFHQRFPDYVRKWVSKHADRSAPKEDLEDWTQDLLIHLYHLPQTSKHREAGNYINLCLSNKFRTMHSKRMHDALCRPGNFSLDVQTEGEDLRSVDDEYCHSHSEYLRRAAKASEKQSGDRAFLGEFVNFVRREDPKALPAIDAILATGTLGDAVDWLEVTESEFGRMRGRLGQLAKCFLSGEPVPRRRKLYKKRVAKGNHVPARHASLRSEHNCLGVLYEGVPPYID